MLTMSASRVVDMRELSDNAAGSAVSIDMHGMPLILTWTPLYRERYRQFAQHTLHIIDDYQVRSIAIPVNDRWYYRAQSLGKERWVLCAKRPILVSPSSKSLSYRNDVLDIIDGSGEILQTLDIGKYDQMLSLNQPGAISEMQATERGSIWIGYSDVVYGGLRCYNLNSQITFDILDLPDARLKESFVDCYALNVASDESTWFCSYTDFPIVCLSSLQSLRVWWDNPISGSRGFAVDQERRQVLFAGSYAARHLLHLVELDTMTVIDLQPVGENGQAIGEFIAHGRGSYVYLEADQQLFRIDIRQVDA